MLLPAAPRAAPQLRNEADTAVYSTEKSLSEYRAKLPQAVVDEITRAIGDARDAAKARAGAGQGVIPPTCGVSVDLPDSTISAACLPAAG